MANQLKMALIEVIFALKARCWTNRRIDRDTVARQLQLSKQSKPAKEPPSSAESEIESKAAKAPPGSEPGSAQECRSRGQRHQVVATGETNKEDQGI